VVTWPPAQPCPSTWPSSSWELHLRAERKSPQNIKSYADGVRRLLTWCHQVNRPAVLDRPNVTGFVAALLEAGAEPAIARSRQLAVRRFSSWLAEEGENPLDPLIGLRPPQHQAGVSPGAALPSIQSSAATVPPRELPDAWLQSDPALFCREKSAADSSSVGLAKMVGDMHRSGGQIDIRPAESQCFPDSDAADAHDETEGVQPVVTDGVQERT